MYQDTDVRRVTLYLRPAEGARPASFRQTSGDGWNAYSWAYPRMGIAIVGDLNPEELRTLADSVYRQIGARNDAASGNAWR